MSHRVKHHGKRRRLTKALRDRSAALQDQLRSPLSVWRGAPPRGPETDDAMKKAGRGCLMAVGGLVVLIILIGIIAAIASGGSSKKSTTATTAASSSSQKSGSTTSNVLSQQAPSASPAANDVSISKCGLDPTLNDPTATLTVVNHSSKTSDYVITVAFDSPDGSQFDTGDADVQTLAPGQTGSATASSLKDGAPSNITCKVTQVDRTASAG